MRVAVISFDDGDAAAPDYALRFAGRPIEAHQLESIVALGCERIVAFARRQTPAASRMSAIAHEAGMPIELVTTVDSLCAAVQAADQVLVLAAGLLPDRESLGHLDCPGIAVFPADIAVPCGYERIDATRAWAGALWSPVALAAHLTELPDDIDPVAAWLRIALQSGVPMHAFDAELLMQGNWQIRPGPDALLKREIRVFASRSAKVAGWTPGLFLSEKLGLYIARDPDGRMGARAPRLAAIAALAVAIVAATSGWQALGFLLAGIGFVAACTGRVIERLTAAPTADSWLSLSFLVDLAVFAIVVLSAPPGDGWTGAFVAATFLASIRLAQRNCFGWLRGLIQDRFAFCLILTITALSGAAFTVAAAASLVLLAIMVLQPAQENVADRTDPARVSQDGS